MHSNWRGGQEWREQGLPLTTGSEEACKLYDAIVTQYVGWYDDDSLGGMQGTMLKMTQADPNFVMGQVVKNGLVSLGTGRSVRNDQTFKSNIDTMVSLSETTDGITPREKQHVDAMKLFTHGFTGSAREAWGRILVDYPTDILALKLYHDAYVYMGGSTQLNDGIARILPQWKRDMPLYGYVLGMQAFGLEESKLYPEAEVAALKALEINPRDGWATHTLSHVLEMTGRPQEGITMMRDTEKYWTTCGNLIGHNVWHWAVYYIEVGDYESALELYDKRLTMRLSDASSSLDLVDVTSLLFRLQMEGVDIGDRWETTYKYCKGHIHDHAMTFNDLHLLLSCLGSGNKSAVQEMMTSIQTFVKEGQGSTKEVMEEVGQVICQSFVAYFDGDYAQAVDLLSPVKSKVNIIGGSNAQRDLFNLFLIQAAIKSSDEQHHKLAKTLLDERKVWKPNSPMTDRLMSHAIEIQAY